MEDYVNRFGLYEIIQLMLVMVLISFSVTALQINNAYTCFVVQACIKFHSEN